MRRTTVRRGSDEAAQLRRIERFAAVTTTGDRADLADVPEDAPVWAHASSTRDSETNVATNCDGAAGGATAISVVADTGPANAEGPPALKAWTR